MKKVITFGVLACVLLLTLGAVPIYAQGIPALPHAFYGTVTINNSPAPVSTQVEARGTGVATGIAGNPTTTTVKGIYGTSNPFEPRLIVQGDIEEDTLITFYVNGYSTRQTAEWDSGAVTELDLTVTIPTGAAGGIAVKPTIKAKLFGVSFTFSIDKYGKILETIKFTSKDGKFTLTIPKGTIALDKYGDPLETLEADVDESPPDPPEDAHIIGLAYNFGPDGATFDPPITVEFTYDPDDLPEDLEDEEDLVIAYYDEDDDEWVELDCVVDTVNNTITASVSHFTTFAIIGAVTPPEEEEVVPPEEEEVVPPEEEVAPPEKEVPPKPPVNWPVVGGIIGGVIVVGLLVFFLARRRRAA